MCVCNSLQIHTAGGTVLGSSRGGFDVDRILASLIENNISMVFIIGAWLLKKSQW